MKVTTDIPDEYQTASGETIEIGQDTKGAYFVRCWDADDNLHWEVKGVVIAGDQFRESSFILAALEAAAGDFACSCKHCRRRVRAGGLHAGCSVEAKAARNDCGAEDSYAMRA